MRGLKWAFFGSSLVSAYWNGAATYYRGIIRALSERGHRITFYEPDACDRQKNRDMADPSWARVRVYDADRKSLDRVLEEALDADIIVKASGVGVFDEELEREVLELKRHDNRVIFWDADAPATLDRMAANSEDPFRRLIPKYDLVLTYGGGHPVVNKYKSFGARECVPIYNALDQSTHYRVNPDRRFSGAMGFIGNRLPDREKRVEDFFLNAVGQLPSESFVLGGNGWADKTLPGNVRYLGHVYTHEHNQFNSSVRAVLNLSRDIRANDGFSPATRVFEAAGAAACLITDAWEGIEQFLIPDKEVLVARDGDEVLEHLKGLTEERAREVGDAAYRRIRAEHTYEHRAARVDGILKDMYA